MGWSQSGFSATFFIDQFDDTQLGVDLTAEDNMAALFGSDVTPNFATDTAYGSGTWSTGEASGPGYSAGGQALTGTTLTVSDGKPVWDADDLEWPDSTISAEGVLIYEPNADRMIAAVWFGEEVSSEDGLYKVAWDADGIAAFTLTYTPD